MAGDVRDVIQFQPAALALAHERHVDHRGREQRFAEAARVAMADGRRIAAGEFLGELAAEREAVGVHAGAGEEEDRVAVAHLAGDAEVFRRDFPDGGAREHDGLRLDDAAQRRRLATAPDRARELAALGEARDEAVGALLIGEPRRVADGRVHRDGHRERAAGDEVVDDGGDEIDADFAVEGAAGRGIDGVGHEVLCAEALLDVREKMVPGLDEVGALAARRRGLGVAVRGELAGGRGGRALARALERVEFVVADAGGFVAEAHVSNCARRSSRSNSRRPGSRRGSRRAWDTCP